MMRLLIVFMFSSWMAHGQVKSTAYEVMLKTLLSHSVEEVSVEQAKQMNNTLFLDARERREYEVSHVENAQWVGYENFQHSALEGIARNQKIIVYCSVGYRSEKIAEKLKAMGFTKVYNLYGGIFEWVNQNNPVVDTRGKATNDVHAYSKTWGIWLLKGNKIYE